MALIFGDVTLMPQVGAGLRHALQRRLSELWGLCLIALAAALGLALVSYDPGDPSTFSASSTSPANWLGHVGAFVAEPLMRFLGLGAAVLVAFPAVWGLRFVRHRGEDRIWARGLLLPVAVGLAAVFASAHPVWAGWPLPLGLGGLLGDAGLSALLSAADPLPLGSAVVAITLGLGAATLAATAACLGATTSELAALLEWMLGSLWRTIRALVALFRSRDTSEAVPKGRADGAPAAGRRVEPSAPRTARRAPAAEPAIPAPRSRHGFGIGRLFAALARPAAEAAVQSAPPDAAARSGQRPGTRRAAAWDGTHPELLEDGATESALGSAIRALRNGGMPDPLDRPAPDLAADDDDEAPEPHRMRAGVGPGDAPDDLDDDETLRPDPRPRSSPARIETPQPYDAPPTGLLEAPSRVVVAQVSEEALEMNARQLETVLADYGVRGEITAVRAGPVVTLYELEPAPGLKASRVIGLADDIARSMSALSARVSTVPGRTVIGIELPNERREKVLLREVLESADYRESGHALALALGKTIEGAPCIANLAKMPHLLIAGTTGSGKSVAINTMILSLLYRLSPEQCRVIMIDPKMLELSVYDGIPHLLAPVVTDPKKALVALKWVVAEMEERYRKMSKLGVRNIDGYNARVHEAQARGEEFHRTVQTGFDETTGQPVYETETMEPEAMPMIVVIVDEMADLMMVAGKEIEACIQRLAQMARASGIHLIMATQRPSVDVITGTIKANFPTRISFQVTSKIDSRTILGEQGAEQLLGMGDMLYMAGGGRIRRVHGPFVSDDEVEEVVGHLKTLGTPEYVDAVTDGGDDETQALVDEKLGLGTPGDSDDTLYDKAVAVVARDRKCSTSYIQRKLQIGYNKAARLVEEMEGQGVVTPANAVGKREILIDER